MFWQLVITAIDGGDPSLTSTATLTVSLSDINDNAPSFLKEYRPSVTEQSPPRVVAELFAQDPDDPAIGNGPPFSFFLDPTADPVLARLFRVETNPSKLNLKY